VWKKPGAWPGLEKRRKKPEVTLRPPGTAQPSRKAPRERRGSLNDGARTLAHNAGDKGAMTEEAIDFGKKSQRFAHTV